MSNLALVIALIGVAGVGAQWLAWRTNLPGIALMLVAGILVGPVFGLVNPAEDFGPLLDPMVSIAVALILFEGGLKLNFRELRRTEGAVYRLVIIGVPVAWALTAFACHYIGGLTWVVSVLFGGILVVTGPTVVLPLIRQITLHPRPRAILKWEAIVNDPVGILLAVVTYEYLRQGGGSTPVADAVMGVAASATVATFAGLAGAFAIGWLFPRGKVPEYLKAPVLLVAVVAIFVFSNFIKNETGLLAVTVMGIALANMRLRGFHDVEPFKANISILAVSGVFVILSASLNMDVVRQFEWQFLGLIAALIFLIRPASILLSLAFSPIPWRERLFVGWIAPRGIVAVAISGVFALRLENLGYSDGSALVALSFAIAAGTIVAHGFSARWVAQWLGVSGSKRDVLIVGATDWSKSLAEQLRALDVPVRLVDARWDQLKTARQAGMPTYHGEVLAKPTEDHLDFDQVQAIAATSDNEAYNTLICNAMAPIVGRDAVYQLGTTDDDDPRAIPDTMRGFSLFGSGLGVQELAEREAAGWKFRQTKISEQFRFSDLRRTMRQDAELLLLVRPSGIVRFFNHASRPRARAGDVIVSYGPPDKEAARTK